MPDKSFFFILAFLIFSMQVKGQDTISQASELANLPLEDLMNIDVFTASKKNQKLTEAPAIINIVSRKDIQNMGVTSLIDVFKYIPGIETSIASDGYYRLSIRGARKEGNILVLINGQHFNDFYNGRAIFDLPVDMIEKIEIVRGPGSPLFGSNAVAGVINIFTIKNSDATIKAGTNNTFSGNWNYNFAKKTVQLNVSASYYQSDGANVQLENDAAKFSTWSLTYDSLSHKTDWWKKDAYLSTCFSAGNLKLNLFELNRRQGAWAGPAFIIAPGSELYTNQFLGNISYDFNLNKSLTITPRIYGSTIHHNYLNQETPENYLSTVSGDNFINGKQSREKYVGITYGTEITANYIINKDLGLLIGVLGENLSLPDYEIKRNYKIVGDEYRGNFGNYDSLPFSQKAKERNIFAYYLQGDYRWKRMNIVAGFRYDVYSDFGNSFNPRLGLIYHLSDKLRLKGLFGKAFRAPTFLELYDNSTIGNEYGVKGNVGLKPETIKTSELGAEFNNKKIILRMNIFYYENQNLIRIYDPHGGGSIGVYENIGLVNSYGYEGEAILSFTPSIQFFVNISQFFSQFEWNDANVRKSDVVYLANQSYCNRQLKNIPSLRANGGINYGIKKFNFFMGLNFGGPAENNRRFYLENDKLVEIPIYMQGNFSINYTFNPKLNFRISGNNIGVKYSDPDETTNINVFGIKGLRQPGPTILLGITYRFEK